MLEGLNRMTFNLLSSAHAKHIAQSTSWDKLDQNQRKVGTLTLEKPCEVLFIGLDTNTFKKPESVSFDLSSIKESFCFLSVGHFLPGPQNLEDRKMRGRLIKTFLETFKDKKNKPALIMKTAQAGSSILDREAILDKIDQIRNMVDSKDLPNIYLLHGDVEDKDMNDLYNHEKVKALVSLTKGEGFGRPLLEFSLSKKPIITTSWSGHLDFLDKESTILLPGELKKIHPSCAVKNILIPESSWFNVNETAAKKAMSEVYENYKKFSDMGKKQSHKSRTEFSFEKMVELLNNLVSTYPKPEVIQLPKLKKIELPKIKKVEHEHKGLI
jgi:glycosyltransferase involved in cell wall biosynthesis